MRIGRVMGRYPGAVMGTEESEVEYTDRVYIAIPCLPHKIDGCSRFTRFQLYCPPSIPIVVFIPG